MKHINFVLIFLLITSVAVMAQSIPSTDSGGPPARNVYPTGWGTRTGAVSIGFPQIGTLTDTQMENGLGGGPSGLPPNGDVYYLIAEFQGAATPPEPDWQFGLKDENEHAEATITGLVVGNTYEIEAYVARTGDLYDQSNKEQFDTPADLVAKNAQKNAELTKAGFIIDGVEYGVPLTDFEWHQVPISFVATDTTATITTAAAVAAGGYTPSWSSFYRKNKANVMFSIGSNAITTTNVACAAGTDAPEF